MQERVAHSVVYVLYVRGRLPQNIFEAEYLRSNPTAHVCECLKSDLTPTSPDSTVLCSRGRLRVYTVICNRIEGGKYLRVLRKKSTGQVHTREYSLQGSRRSLSDTIFPTASEYFIFPHNKRPCPQ